MRTIISVLLILLLSACDQRVVEPMDVVVPGTKRSSVALGNTCSTLDVTETTISAY